MMNKENQGRKKFWKRGQVFAFIIGSALLLLLGLWALRPAPVQAAQVQSISTFPYEESFETDDGGWTIGQESGSPNSWEHGAPAGATINSAADGSNAWVTNLDGNHADNEKSYVISPIFDFSALTDPEIEMAIWRHIEYGFDGAKLQSSTDSGTTWTTVGVTSDPDWYQYNAIPPLLDFTDNGHGWTADSGTGWETVTHALDGLAGQSNVQLRIVFGSDSSWTQEGLAFDLVKVRGTVVSSDDPLVVSALDDVEDGDYSSGNNSLREAIANATAGDTITFDPTLSGGTITLAGTQLVINKNLSISATIPISVSANNQSRVFSVENGANATLYGLTIRDGNQTATESRCQNFACGGGVYIASGSHVTVSHSAVVSNSAGFGAGIIAFYNANVTVERSTIAGNSASSRGGGINAYNSTAMVSNSTIVENSADSAGGGTETIGGSIILDHTIVANNTGDDCDDAAVSNGYNLDSDGTCLGSSSAMGDLANTDPLLAPLGNYGGGTLTYGLLPGSPAINAGDAARNSSTDQRGEPLNGTRDIGAFERQGTDSLTSAGGGQVAQLNTAFANPLTVNISNDENEPVGPGAPVVFTAPVAGASLATTTFTETTDATGQAAATVTANGIDGTYNVTASVNGVAGSEVFEMTNQPPITLELNWWDKTGNSVIGYDTLLVYGFAITNTNTTYTATDVVMGATSLGFDIGTTARDIGPGEVYENELYDWVDATNVTTQTVAVTGTAWISDVAPADAMTQTVVYYIDLFAPAFDAMSGTVVEVPEGSFAGGMVQDVGNRGTTDPMRVAGVQWVEWSTDGTNWTRTTPSATGVWTSTVMVTEAVTMYLRSADNLNHQSDTIMVVYEPEAPVPVADGLMIFAVAYQEDPGDGDPTGNLDGYISIKNMSASPVSLNGFKIGDAATADMTGRGLTTDGMFELPNVMLAAGEEIFIAEDADNWPYTEEVASYSFAPNSAGVPELTMYTAWSNGAVDLDNSSDEVVLLDASDNLVDGMCWGVQGTACELDDGAARATTTILTDGRLLDRTDDEGFRRSSPMDTNSQADWMSPTAVQLQQNAVTVAEPFALIFAALAFVTAAIVGRRAGDIER